METLKEIKIDFYDNLYFRYNQHLGDQEQHIIKHLESECNLDGYVSKYTKDEAFDISCQALDGHDFSDMEETCWEAGYVLGYEQALKGILSIIQDSNNKLVTEETIYNLLNN